MMKMFGFIGPSSKLFITLLHFSILIQESQLALSTMPVYLMESAAWNPHCNSTTYVRLSGGEASVTVSVSQGDAEHRLYGSCLFSVANAESRDDLYISFTKYPAFHNCVSATLSIYELIDSESVMLWTGECGDDPHIWPPRALKSQTSEVWIWYRKWREWPDLLPYSEMDFELKITAAPLADTCDDSLCSNHGVCTLRKPDPPPNIETFSTYRYLHQCHCVQPYTGHNCDKVKLEGYNPCQPDLCHNQGRCVINSTYISGFFCDCPLPYNGDLCQYNSAVCRNSTDVCGKHGHCEVIDSEVVCMCEKYWIGRLCEVATACVSSPCQNSGLCTSHSSDIFTCTCEPPWSGVICAYNNSTGESTSESTSESGVNATTSDLEVAEQSNQQTEGKEPYIRKHPIATAFILILTVSCVLLFVLAIHSIHRKGRDKKLFIPMSESQQQMTGDAHLSTRRWTDLLHIAPSTTSSNLPHVRNQHVLQRASQTLRELALRSQRKRNQQLPLSHTGGSTDRHSMADVVSMTSIAGPSTFPRQRLEEPNTSLEKERYEIEKILTTTEAENPDLHRGDNSNVIDSDSTVGLETADNAEADTIHDATFAQGLKEGNSNIILAAHEFYMHNYPTYYVDSHVPSIQNRKDIKEHRKRIACLLKKTQPPHSSAADMSGSDHGDSNITKL